MLKWLANSPKSLLQQVGGRIRGRGGWFLRFRGAQVSCCLFLNCMSGCGRGHGVLVVRPVRLPRSHPRVLHLAGQVHLFPRVVPRQRPPGTKGG